MANPHQSQPSSSAPLPVLEVVHVLPTRVRLRWSASLDDAALEALCGQLAGLPWLEGCERRAGSRSLLLRLQPHCPASLWQTALADLGWRLKPVPGVSVAALANDVEAPGPANPWSQLSRQMGGSMMGASLGQMLVGGGLATAGAAVAGSIAGSAIADGQASSLPDTLGQLSWRRLSTRMGEEAGSRSGMALGAAVAGPVGAVAGLAVGSMVGGHLVTDLTGPASRRAVIGQGRWFAAMVQDSTGESLSQSLASRLGAGLTGGSAVGRELGATLGSRFGGRIDWTASVQQHRLVPMTASRSRPAGHQAGRTEG